MSLSQVRGYFGVHSIAPYNVNTGKFYGMVRVLKGSSFSLTGETIDLTGGSQPYPWLVEDGLITEELALNFGEFPDFLYEVFLGKKPTANAAQALGSVDTLTDVNGTLVDATTGLASIGIKTSSEGDLKFGSYLIEAITATTVNVYASSNVDFNRGTDTVFNGDDLSIIAADITIGDTSDVQDITDFGLEITGGSGTVAMTIGDTAKFNVQPPNSGSSIVKVGGVADSFAEFGALVYGQKRGNSEMVELDIYRLKGIGLPHNFTPKEWAESEVTAKAFYDSAKDGVFSVRTIKPV